MCRQASHNNQVSVGQSSGTSQDQSNRHSHTVLSQDDGLCWEDTGAEDPSRSLVRNFDRLEVQNKDIAGWIQSLPLQFDDSKDGVIKELASSSLNIFRAIQRTVNQPESPLLEQQQRYKLWLTGIGSLDHELDKQPSLRKCVVSNLVGLMLVLINGKKLFSVLCTSTY